MVGLTKVIAKVRSIPLPPSPSLSPAYSPLPPGMGPILLRPRKHNRLRPHPHPPDGRKRSRCLRHRPRRHQDPARDTQCPTESQGRRRRRRRRKARSWRWGKREIPGYPAPETGQRDGGSECDSGGGESADGVCEWADYYGYGREEYVTVDGGKWKGRRKAKGFRVSKLLALGTFSYVQNIYEF